MSMALTSSCASKLRLGSLAVPSPVQRLQQLRAFRRSTCADKSVVSDSQSQPSRAMLTRAAATMVEPLSGTNDSRFTTAGYRRSLHWVFKVGDLQKTLEFYEKVLGMHVHRHEEFASGCEATCNGPYAGAWSKTMVGYGTEETNFALELTYNSGISSYKQGNDLRYIAMNSRALKASPTDLGYGVEKLEDGSQLVTGPDGYKFKLIDCAESEGLSEPFLFVSLHVSDLDRAKGFYTNVLGARVFENIPGAEQGPDSVMLGFETQKRASFPEGGVKLELVQLPAGQQIDHAEAKGRFATETEDGAEYTIADKVKEVDEKLIVHGPLKLQPHGEEVVIVVDQDGNEYCFVDARGYTNCMNVAYQSGGRTVDWEYREKLNAAAMANDKQLMARLLGGKYDVEEVQQKLKGIVKDHPVVVFSQTSCPYCQKTKALFKDLGARIHVVELDSLGAEGQAMRAELGVLTGRSSVPNVFIGAQNVGGFSDGPGVEALNKEGKLVGMLQTAGAV